MGKVRFFKGWEANCIQSNTYEGEFYSYGKKYKIVEKRHENRLPEGGYERTFYRIKAPNGKISQIPHDVLCAFFDVL